MTTTAPTRPREIWTRLTVDPVADPLARWLAHLPGVTPNRVTLGAIALALGSAASFATGHLRIGGVLFILRFFVDCLDGKVAREQGTSSTRGAALDIAADVTGIAIVLTALSSHLVAHGNLDPRIAMALLASIIIYNWALAYRKDLAHRIGQGDGGADYSRISNLRGLQAWQMFCRRLNMSPLPWVLEMEILMLGLAPLLLPLPLVRHALAVGLAFYVVADLVNLRRIWRIAGQLDQTSPRGES